MMEERNRYVLMEILFTLILLIAVVSLFGNIVLAYRLLFVLGVTAGFSFSLFYRNRQASLTGILTNSSVLGIFLWIVYSLMNSSLLYKEVILIFIKGVFVLEIIFSFNSSRPSFLTYIQALSFPLIMCFPVFIKEYSQMQAISVLVYIISWVAILRIKFYGLIKSVMEKKIRQYFSILISSVFFLIILSISWLLFYNISFTRLEKGEFLPKEDREAEIEVENLEKEYYELQDKVQEEITEMIPELDSNEEKRQTLIMLSSLIKESPDVSEVKKAELGLISLLKKPGPGLEKEGGDAISSSVKNYMDKKIALNLRNLKEYIGDGLKRNRFNIMERASSMNRLNNMRVSSSLHKIKKNERELKQIINNSSAAKNAKNDLKELANRFKEWKVMELSKRKRDSLNKKADSSPAKLKEEFTDFLIDIDNTDNLSGVKKAESRIERLKDITPRQQEDMVEDAEELLDLKTEMLLAQKKRALKEKIDNLKLPGDESQGIKEAIDAVEDSRDYRDFSKNSSQFRERIEESRINPSAETAELFDIKTHLLFMEQKEKIKSQLEKGNLPDKGEEFMKDLDKLPEETEIDKLSSGAEKLKKDIEKFLNQGLISSSDRDKLMKDIEETSQILQAKLEAQKAKDAEKKLDKEQLKSDYRKEWEELLDKSSLKEERKESLGLLTEELFKAQSVTQLENVREAAEKEIDALANDKVGKEEIKKLKESFNSMAEINKVFIIEKALASLREKIDDLRQVNSEEAEKIEKFLEKIRESRTSEELKEQINAFKEHLNQNEEEEKKKSEKKAETGSFDINILPSHIVISTGSTTSLKAVAVYNNMFVKEISSEAEWFSADPRVAWVDERGILHPVSKGRAEIYANYRGKQSHRIEVVVADKISEELDKATLRESIR